jgi:hypothetical protein
MADANPDGLPLQSVEHIARFLVVSAHEDRALIRRSRPAAPDDFLNRVRHLPAMLFTNTPRPNARIVTPFRRSALPPLLADESVMDTGAMDTGARDIGARDTAPRARTAAERLELAIEAADRSEQSLAAMQSALDRAHRRNLVFGVAACAVLAVSLGLMTMGRAYVGGHEQAPEVLASAATPAVTNTLPVPPLPQGPLAASQGPSIGGPSADVSRNATPPFAGLPGPIQAQISPGTPVLADNTAGPAMGASDDSPSSPDVGQDPVQPRLIDANEDDASALLRTLPPGSIIVSPLPEPPAALQAEQPDLSSVQPISVTSTASVEALPPRHHYAARRTRSYAYRSYYRPYSYSPINRLPEQFGRMVDNLGRNIRSLF